MKKQKLACLTIAMTMTVATACIALTACGDGNLPKYDLVLPQQATLTDASVHDPSVFYDDASGKYYAFGSHFAVASSTDLMQWKQEAYDGTAGATKLFGTANWRGILSQTNSLVGGNENIWAPDVEKIGDTYYMYYSVTSGFGSSKSVIGRVSSKNVLGPYGNEEIIVRSTGAGGSQPNCIDPELFYDKSGNLYMVYGSFYGGIYLRELNKDGSKAGLPKEGGETDYGTLLWKGGKTGVEGPFIFYNAELGYYYLMTSDGSLRNNDGTANYNMRVARSKDPAGPYEDITGAKMADAYGGGNKLAGNYQFSGTQGFGAMGHNSVVKVGTNYLVVSHIRRRESGNNLSLGHNLSVNQLYFNEDGWPVMSPNRYAGETKGCLEQAGVPGNYDVIVHTEKNSYDFAESARYTFNGDGTISSATAASAGTWTLKNKYYIEITLDNVLYKGVVAPGWNRNQKKGMICMTATSDKGVALWANGVIAAES